MTNELKEIKINGESYLFKYLKGQEYDEGRRVWLYKDEYGNMLELLVAKLREIITKYPDVEIHPRVKEFIEEYPNSNENVITHRLGRVLNELLEKGYE
ncbi:MAG TPA: hypothetical protein DCF70_07595 [Treponema sp.]|nr:hypothetical protein [Treponema sp.]